MLSFEIGDTTVHLAPLLIFIVVILPFTVLLTAIVKTKQINNKNIPVIIKIAGSSIIVVKFISFLFPLSSIFIIA